MGSKNHQGQLEPRPAPAIGTCPANPTDHGPRNRRHLNPPSPPSVELRNPFTNHVLQIGEMKSDIMNTARYLAELEQRNSMLTTENAELKAHAPEGWIPPAEVLKQLEQQAEKHAAQVEALDTEHTSQIKSLEAQVEELEVRLGKYKTAVDDVAKIT